MSAAFLRHLRLREAQRKWEPQLRAGDLSVIRWTSILINRSVGGSQLPEHGYQIAYQGIPLSPAEKRAEREDITALIEAGLLDRISALQRMSPGMSRLEAERALQEIASINARYRVT